MGGLGGRDNWSIGDKGKVDARVWNEISLELVQVDIERTVETEGSGDGRYNCRYCQQPDLIR